MYYNRLISLERQRQGALSQLRKDAERWIERTQSSKEKLARLSDISPQLLGYFLAGERGLSTQTYSKLASVVRNQDDVRAPFENPATFEHIQNLGVKTAVTAAPDIDNVKLAFEKERAAQIQAANERKEFQS